MEVVANLLVEAILAVVSDPVVIAIFAVVSLALFSGLAARVTEVFEARC